MPDHKEGLRFFFGLLDPRGIQPWVPGLHFLAAARRIEMERQRIALEQLEKQRGDLSEGADEDSFRRGWEAVQRLPAIRDKIKQVFENLPSYEPEGIDPASLSGGSGGGDDQEDHRS